MLETITRKEPQSKNKTGFYISESFNLLSPVFRSWYFYIGLFSLIAGAELNFISQTYLYNHTEQGKNLPLLSDMILDELPVYDVSVFYDIFSIIPVILLLVYIFHKKQYKKVPFFLLMCGLIEIVRGIFIVITPLGNPPGFTGSDTLFNGFSKYELGVYPSGHVGNVFLLFLLIKDRYYRMIILFCLLMVILSLFYSHGHYSIDILSGIFFAYAINAFGEKHLKMFDLGSSKNKRLT